MFGQKVAVALATVFAWVFGVFFASDANPVQAGSAVLIAFESDHCGHCTAMQPILRSMSNQGTPIRVVSVDREPDFAKRHGVRQVPTFIVWSSGKELTRLVGSQTSESLYRALSLENGGPLVHTDALVSPNSILNAPETRLAPMANRVRESGGDRVGSEAFPNRTIADSIEKARAATVRLKVHDGRGFGVGTGTIIDRHGSEALVLTCGHLFRETKLEARIDVDLFIAGQIRTVPGKVIDYDADQRDIALVVIQPGIDIEPIPVLPGNEKPQSGQAVFSFGCDHGDDPSRRDTRLTGINKYNQHVGASNLEIAGAPVDGRSGGGLFDEAGRLIGVCNAADYKGDVGIYTGPGSVYWQLDRVQLARLYQRGSANVPPSQPRPSAVPVSNQPGPRDQPTRDQPTLRQPIVVFIPDASVPEGRRVLELIDPSPELMRLIERQASNSSASSRF